MTPRPGRSAHIAGAAVLLAAVVAQAQGPAPVPATVKAGQFAPAAVEMRVAEWRVAARTHVGGQIDEPAVSVARWPPDLTRIVVDRVIKRTRDQPSRAPDDSATDSDHRTVLAKGLLLHTDIALAERTSEAGAATGTRAWTLLDAKPLAGVRFSRHWGLSRLLAEALAQTPAGAPIARAWFRAAGALYQQWADFGQLRAHLAAGADLVPDDPVLLLYAGTLHQGYADARVQSYLARFRGMQRGQTDRFVVYVSIEDADAELGLAARALRRAVAIDPSLVEARIRLAHVQGARGKPADAIPLAREALASPLPPFLEYYGAMVLGRAEARLGRHAEARAAFERAVTRYPHSHAAQVALSQVGLAEGRTADGVAALMRALGPGAPEKADDPWSWYFRLHAPDAQHYLDDLRRSAP
jgi:tetratricopeptide (TPR) repeat protein